MDTNFDIFMVLGVGFAPTPEDVGRRMMGTAHLGRGETFYDFGSGDGGLLITASKEFGAYSVGVEIQKKLVEYSEVRIQSLGLERMIKVVRGDFFEVDVSAADVLGLYLSPWILGKLRLKLERELGHGARIVVYKYPIEGWNPKRIRNAKEDTSDRSKIFLYEI